MTITAPFTEALDMQAIVADLCTVNELQQQATMTVAVVTPLQSAATIYPLLQARAHAQHHTVWLRQSNTPTRIELVFLPGVPAKTAPRWVLALSLLLLTMISCLAAGSLYRGIDIFAQPMRIYEGWRFAATILGILATHELGHYVVGRWWGAPVSLPYFIPLPPPLSFTGTLGAVIVQREPMRDRRVLFDVGLAGPLAGLCVAIPLLFVGLSQSTVGPTPSSGFVQEGNSALYLVAKLIMFGRILPGGGLDVQLNDVAFAAWIGLLVTMFNLLPIGQLDGGHVTYAVLGRYAIYVAYSAIAFCLLLGIFVDNTWLVWAGIAYFANPRHPAPYDDTTPIGLWRILLACFTVMLLLLLLTPAPLHIVP